MRRTMRRITGAGIPYLVLLLAAGMVAVGLAMGEFQSVLANAVTVCLSCIGIG